MSHHLLLSDSSSLKYWQTFNGHIFWLCRKELLFGVSYLSYTLQHSMGFMGKGCYLVQVTYAIHCKTPWDLLRQCPNFSVLFPWRYPFSFVSLPHNDKPDTQSYTCKLDSYVLTRKWFPVRCLVERESDKTTTYSWFTWLVFDSLLMLFLKVGYKKWVFFFHPK